DSLPSWPVGMQLLVAFNRGARGRRARPGTSLASRWWGRRIPRFHNLRLNGGYMEVCEGGSPPPRRGRPMPSYKAPVDDVLFLMNDVFHVDRYANLPGFADASPDVVEAILTETAKYCGDTLTPLNRSGDKEGCKRLPDGSVTTPKGFREAFK